MQNSPRFLPIFLLLLPVTCPSQTWKWANSHGAPNTSTTVQTIRKYTGTKVITSGSFAAPSLSLGSLILSNAGQDDGYVAIANDAGQYEWAGSFGGSGQDFVADAAASASGEFVVAGNFNSTTITIGGTTLFNSGETDAFVAKYNADKSLAWFAKIGTANVDEVRSVALDADGNVYVSGQVADKFTLATIHTFLRKFDAAGNQVWERTGTKQGNTLQITAMSLDGDQAIYLAGSVMGKATFGNTTLECDTSAAAFILKYHADGSILDSYLNPDVEKFNGLQANGNHLYACGEKMFYCIGWGWPLSHSKTHVLRLDADLNTLWHKTLGGETPCLSLDIARSLSVDEGGNVYVTGSFFSDTLHFAGQELANLFNVNYYYPQIFVFKYAASGDEIWGKSLGGFHIDEGTCVHAVGDDKFFLGGNFESNPVAFGAFELQNTGTLTPMYVHLQPSRYGRKQMGFLSFFDKDLSSSPDLPFQEVVMFPNPASEQITLRLNAAADAQLTLQIHSADGQLLRQTEHTATDATIREDLTGLTPGIYFLSLRMPEGVFSGKFIKL